MSGRELCFDGSVLSSLWHLLCDFCGVGLEYELAKVTCHRVVSVLRAVVLLPSRLVVLGACHRQRIVVASVVKYWALTPFLIGFQSSCVPWFRLFDFSRCCLSRTFDAPRRELLACSSFCPCVMSALLLRGHDLVTVVDTADFSREALTQFMRGGTGCEGRKY